MEVYAQWVGLDHEISLVYLGLQHVYQVTFKRNEYNSKKKSTLFHLDTSMYNTYSAPTAVPKLLSIQMKASSPFRPIVRKCIGLYKLLTKEEMQLKQNKRLYFHWDEKYLVGYHCKNWELHVLIMGEALEGDDGVKDDQGFEKEESMELDSQWNYQLTH